ncbi:TAXI family TRAP transporter solute-binding subunit [Brevibacterium otitidis]|uniref:TAXI family TRAP transporter solute-binding subunit n=1 Tax=Brevibacterium otitidis TaxID=53364 RepID=A0ABV5X3G6_9MICO|nr:TAXI family TRAP transporter solute-binding subunit [Brevibacterium otitidis]
MHLPTVRLITAAAAASVLVLAGCGQGSDSGNAEPTRDLTFATGGTAGVYYPLGSEFSRLFQEEVEGLSVVAVETDGSVDNLGRIAKGEAQLAFSQTNTANNARDAEAEFSDLDRGIDNIGFIGQIYPEAVHVITLEDSGIETFEDLKGKRVAIGAPGSANKAVAALLFDAYGIEEGDYTPFEESFADARSKLQDGHVDASIEIIGVPAASLGELDASADVRLISLDEDKAEEVSADNHYETYTIPGGSYGFADEDITTVAVFASIVASLDQVSEEDAYGITKTIYERSEDITLAQKRFINLDDALFGRGGVPLHPGAKRYYEEQGIDTGE